MGKSISRLRRRDVPAVIRLRHNRSVWLRLLEVLSTNGRRVEPYGLAVHVALEHDIKVQRRVLVDERVDLLHVGPKLHRSVICKACVRAREDPKTELVLPDGHHGIEVQIERDGLGRVLIALLVDEEPLRQLVRVIVEPLVVQSPTFLTTQLQPFQNACAGFYAVEPGLETPHP